MIAKISRELKKITAGKLSIPRLFALDPAGKTIDCLTNKNRCYIYPFSFLKPPDLKLVGLPVLSPSQAQMQTMFK